MLENDTDLHFACFQKGRRDIRHRRDRTLHMPFKVFIVKKLIYQYNIDIQISVAYAAHSACNKRKRSDDFDTGSASYPNSGGLVNYGEEEEGVHVEITQHLGLLESEGYQDSGASRSTQVSSVASVLVIKFAMWTGREHD